MHFTFPGTCKLRQSSPNCATQDTKIDAHILNCCYYDVLVYNLAGLARIGFTPYLEPDGTAFSEYRITSSQVLIFQMDLGGL
jgi:hypothetical protein